MREGERKRKKECDRMKEGGEAEDEEVIRDERGRREVDEGEDRMKTEEECEIREKGREEERGGERRTECRRDEGRGIREECLEREDDGGIR